MTRTMFASFNTRALGLNLAAPDTIEQAALAGFGGVDLLVRDLVNAGSNPRGLRARMDDLGLRGGAWPLPVDWRGDEGRFLADLADLPRYAEAAATLGLSRTGTWLLPETPEMPATQTDRDSLRRAALEFQEQRLAPIARILGNQGIRLGLEVIGVESFRSGRGMPLFTRFGDDLVDDLLRSLRRESPAVGLLVDAFHLHAAGEPMATAWARGVEPIVWVHVADLPAGPVPDRIAIRDHDRGLPGENSAIDLATLLRGLAIRGYDGPVTAEPLAGCRSLAGLDVPSAARKVAAALRDVWPPGTPGAPATA